MGEKTLYRVKILNRRFLVEESSLVERVLWRWISPGTVGDPVDKWTVSLQWSIVHGAIATNG